MTFLMSMCGISILNFLPWSKDDEDRYMLERAARKKTEATRTYAEEKKMKDHARYPPTTYEKALLLITTYALVLEMLFSTRNEHQQGVVAVKEVMLEQSKTAYNKGPLYWMQVIWGVMCGQTKHNSQRMRPVDFEGGRRTEMRWPSSGLKRGLVAMM